MGDPGFRQQLSSAPAWDPGPGSIQRGARARLWLRRPGRASPQSRPEPRQRPPGKRARSQHQRLLPWAPTTRISAPVRTPAEQRTRQGCQRTTAPAQLATFQGAAALYGGGLCCELGLSDMDARGVACRRCRRQASGAMRLEPGYRPLVARCRMRRVHFQSAKMAPPTPAWRTVPTTPLILRAMWMLFCNPNTPGETSSRAVAGNRFAARPAPVAFSQQRAMQRGPVRLRSQFGWVHAGTTDRWDSEHRAAGTAGIADEPTAERMEFNGASDSGRRPSKAPMCCKNGSTDFGTEANASKGDRTSVSDSDCGSWE